ncbi:CatB-related O-acetyltransferase [Clostridium chauvoei]|uniref:CatB-related O-acetyltransferase n=1 Tax=Clostridium chauvoei TaxID=46867 RepID=UPI001C86623D|nr:CatB-related O-acetyltransferase [Clostridium chauvoei]MBX7294992.1 CatB-related O-acetyltransferase [Clostridium chauvoei]
MKNIDFTKFYINDIKQIIIPSFFKKLRKVYIYKKIFKNSYVSYKAKVDIKEEVKLGENSRIYENVNIGVKSFKLGDFSTISGPTQIVGLGKVTIGKFCSIAPDVYMVTNNHNMNNLITYPTEFIYDTSKKDHIIEDIKIGNYVWIGRGVTILPGVNIGDGCIVGAGSVVTKGNYEHYSIIVGVKGKVINKRFSEEVIKEIKEKNIFNKDINTFKKYLEEFN